MIIPKQEVPRATQPHLRHKNIGVKYSAYWVLTLTSKIDHKTALRPRLFGNLRKRATIIVYCLHPKTAVTGSGGGYIIQPSLFHYRP